MILDINSSINFCYPQGGNVMFKQRIEAWKKIPLWYLLVQRFLRRTFVNPHNKIFKSVAVGKDGFFQKSSWNANTGTSAYVTTVFCSFSNLCSLTLKPWRGSKLGLSPAELLHVLATILSLPGFERRQYLVSYIRAYWLALLWEAGRPTFQAHSSYCRASASPFPSLGLRFSIFQVTGWGELFPQWETRALVGWHVSLIIRHMFPYCWTT